MASHVAGFSAGILRTRAGRVRRGSGGPRSRGAAGRGRSAPPALRPPRAAAERWRHRNGSRAESESLPWPRACVPGSGLFSGLRRGSPPQFSPSPPAPNAEGPPARRRRERPPGSSPIPMRPIGARGVKGFLMIGSWVPRASAPSAPVGLPCSILTYMRKVLVWHLGYGPRGLTLLVPLVAFAGLVASAVQVDSQSQRDVQVCASRCFPQPRGGPLFRFASALPAVQEAPGLADSVVSCQGAVSVFKFALHSEVRNPLLSSDCAPIQTCGFRSPPAVIKGRWHHLGPTGRPGAKPQNRW